MHARLGSYVSPSPACLLFYREVLKRPPPASLAPWFHVAALSKHEKQYEMLSGVTTQGAATGKSPRGETCGIVGPKHGFPPTRPTPYRLGR